VPFQKQTFTTGGWECGILNVANTGKLCKFTTASPLQPLLKQHPGLKLKPPRQKQEALEAMHE
jgi:hypothetical protein